VSRSDGKIPVAARPSEPRTGGRSATYPADVDLDDILPVSRRLRPVDAAAVDDAETTLGTRFPTGYRELMVRLGEGDLGHFLRVYPPHRVLASQAEWRARITEYWFWESDDETLRDRVRDGVVLGDTFDGDELCFHRSDPDTLILLPRHDDAAHQLGPGLLAAVDWVLRSGVIVSQEPGPVAFEPWLGRVEVRRHLVGGDIDEVATSLASHDPGSLVVPVSREPGGLTSVTVYLPAIGGRAHHWWFADGGAVVALTYDDSAPADVAERVVQELDRRAQV
jgi:hypothetical protein